MGWGTICRAWKKGRCGNIPGPLAPHSHPISELEEVMSTYCPYCDKDIEEEIMREWQGDYWDYTDDFECPKCGKELEIDVESEPVFHAHKRE